MNQTRHTSPPAWNFRGRFNNKIRDKVLKVQATQSLQGNKMTQEQTIEFIIHNFEMR